MLEIWKSAKRQLVLANTTLCTRETEAITFPTSVVTFPAIFSISFILGFIQNIHNTSGHQSLGNKVSFSLLWNIQMPLINML